MTLRAPANHDTAILSDLAARSVTEVYGRLPQDVVDGGRPAYMADPLNEERLTAPKLMVAAGWIRPGDLGRNEALGFSTFKLLERNIPSAEQVKRAETYHSQRFDAIRPPFEVRNGVLQKKFWEWFKRKNYAGTDCDTRRFCEKVAKAAVPLDPEFLQQVLPAYEKVQADLIDRAFLTGGVS